MSDKTNQALSRCLQLDLSRSVTLGIQINGGEAQNFFITQIKCGSISFHILVSIYVINVSLHVNMTCSHPLYLIVFLCFFFCKVHLFYSLLVFIDFFFYFYITFSWFESQLNIRCWQFNCHRQTKYVSAVNNGHCLVIISQFYFTSHLPVYLLVSISQLFKITVETPKCEKCCQTGKL